MKIVNIAHLLGAGRYAVQGIKHAVLQEQAFKHEVLVLLTLCIVLAVVRPGFLISSLVLGGWLFVMALELLNSAIEALCDMIQPDFDKRIGHIKDMGSGAVLCGLIANGLFWCALIIGYLLG